MEVYPRFFSSDDTEIPEMPIELFLIDKLKTRVHLARQIDLHQHKIKKAKHERHWITETAEALELELDSDFMR
jgi:ATP-dependent RNA helicase DDX24/MAK5